MLNDTFQRMFDALDRLEGPFNEDDTAALYRVIAELDAKMLRALHEFDRTRLYLQSNASSTEEFLECNLGLSSAAAATTARAARALR